VRNRIAAVFAVLVMTLGGVIGGATPASASWNACPDGDMCFWSNTNYWGNTAFYWPVRTVCYPVADWASSIRNRTGTTVRIFSGGQCSGVYVDVFNGQSFSPPPSPVGDNNIDSFRAG
jgi:hypothetical protein